MSKRKQPDFAINDSNDVISDDFGSLEKVKDYYHVLPLHKSIQGANGKKHYDLFDFVNIPRFRRSVRGCRREKKTAVPDAGKRVGSVSKAKGISWHVRNTPKADTEESDSDSDSDSGIVVIYTPVCSGRVLRRPRGSALNSLNVCSGRVLRRSRGSALNSLNTGKLSSTMFEIHIENMWKKLSDEEKNEVTYLDSLLFSLLANRVEKEKVLSWIKKKDIFSKKYVFVPIVQWGHWFLLIFCHFGESSDAKSQSRCMLLLDSLQEAHSKQMESCIRKIVPDIFKIEERPESKELIRKIPLLIPKVPQQKNGEACGYFVLYYIYQFLKCASDNFSFSKGCTHFMKEDWFTHEDVESFTKSLDSMTECAD